MNAGWWREKGSPIAQLMAVSVLVGGSVGVSCAPPAHADPTDNYITVYGTRVCQLLDANNSLQGVVNVAEGIRADGFGADAGRILVDSVTIWCPRHTQLLRDFIDVYAPEHGGRLV